MRLYPTDGAGPERARVSLRLLRGRPDPAPAPGGLA